MTFLEKNAEEYVTLSELQNIMAEKEIEPYVSTWICKRTLHQNSVEAIITRIPGKNDHIVSFKTKHFAAIKEDFLIHYVK